MMNKALVWASFVIFFRLTKSQSRSFFAHLDQVDVIFQGNLSAEYDAFSLTKCAVMCGSRCTYFGVNLQKKKCRIHTGRQSSNLKVEEAGWRYYKKEPEGDGWLLYRTHYYLHIQNNTTWQNAKDECEKLGTYLVTIETEEENSWLTEMFLPVWDPAQCSSWWHCCSIWIGANDIDQEGTFVWTKNNSDFTLYSNWHPPNEPDNNGGQDCVHICRNGTWGDYYCDRMLSYICEKE